MGRSNHALRHGVALFAGLIVSCTAIGGAEEPVCVVVPFEPSSPPAAQAKMDPLPPLFATSSLVDLEVVGHRDALVSLPVGATARRPLIVAAHASGQDPRAWCLLLQAIVAKRAFVLCPRGDALAAGSDRDPAWYFYSTPFALAVEIRDAMVALIKTYKPHVDAKAPVFVGFAEGAAMGAWFLSNHPARFSRALLIEGGAAAFDERNRRDAKRFRERGGVRLFFGCAGSRCLEDADAAAQVASALGVITRVAEGAFGSPSQEDFTLQVDGALEWLMDGDERFASPAP